MKGGTGGTHHFTSIGAFDTVLKTVIGSVQAGTFIFRQIGETVFDFAVIEGEQRTGLYIFLVKRAAGRRFRGRLYGGRGNNRFLRTGGR